MTEQITPQTESSSDDNLRVVTAPVPASHIKDYFVNKDLKFIIDYRESRLKGSVFLTYVTNLNIPSDVLLAIDCPEEEYLEVMEAYFNQRTVCNCKSLAYLFAQIVLCFRGVPYDKLPYATKMPVSHMAAFIERNFEKLFNVISFIDASFVFAYANIPALDASEENIAKLPVVDDKDFVGHNVVNLYNVPLFMTTYFTIEGQCYAGAYFKQQFEQYMFNNERLVTYFNVENNFINTIIHLIADGTIDPSQPQDFIKELENGEITFKPVELPEPSEDGQLPDVGGTQGS